MCVCIFVHVISRYFCAPSLQAISMAAWVKVFSLSKRCFKFEMGFSDGVQKKRPLMYAGLYSSLSPWLTHSVYSVLSLTPRPLYSPPSTLLLLSSSNSCLPLFLSISCQPFQKASIFSRRAVRACCHVAMLPECQAEWRSDGWRVLRLSSSSLPPLFLLSSSSLSPSPSPPLTPITGSPLPRKEEEEYVQALFQRWCTATFRHGDRTLRNSDSLLEHQGLWCLLMCLFDVIRLWSQTVIWRWL